MKTTQAISKELQIIPGVGKSVAQDLIALGIQTPKDLKGKNAEKLYDQLCNLRGQHIDRCMLYVFRCAVYFVETKKPQSRLLLWWNWKD